MIFDVTYAIVGGVLAAAALYLLVLVAAALFYDEDGMKRRRPVRTAERVDVLVPAHDEEASIARCVESLRAQTFPSERYEVVVVADNCTDDTAARAAEAGAQVLVRDE